MKPRDLNSVNWNIQTAVFDTHELEARVTADGKKMWFLVATGLCRADVTMPITDFRKAVDFVDTFDLSTLAPDNTDAGIRLGSWAVEIAGHTGYAKQGKFIYKKVPNAVLLRPWRQRMDCAIVIRLSLFKKLSRWYNSDVE
jgi:hypothetical protein